MTELVVVGAGPAGLAAAVTAADAGVAVTLLDAGHDVGGQIWRQPRRPGARREGLLAAVHRRERVTVRTGTQVVQARRDGDGFALLVRDDAGLSLVPASALVLAPGAGELSLPFPGWELPGVVTPGAAQALLKADGVPIGRRVVVGGTGAFLWPVAASLVAAGVEVAAVVEAQPWRQLARTAALLRHPVIVAQAAGYARVLAAARVPVLTGRVVLRADGDERVEAVRIGTPDGRTTHRFDVDAVCVGWGFVPSVELARGLGCVEVADPIRPSSTVRVDDDLATSVPGVYAAGELTGVGGAVVAEAEGSVAGAAAARFLSRRATPSAGTRRRLRRARRAAGVLARAFPVPNGWVDRLDDDTVICRCEEVPWHELRGLLDDGADSVREVKGQLRCGMGWCQGRTCGPGVQLAVAAWSRRPLGDVGDLAGRPFAAPLTVGELAGLSPGTDRPTGPA